MTGALFLILVPLTAAVLTYFIDGRTKTARIILILTAVFHAIMTAGVIFLPALRSDDSRWLGFDDLGMTVLAITSLLFLAVSIHTAFWIPADRHYAHSHSHILLFGKPVFLPAMMAFLATMSMVIAAKNFGLLWVAVEATTLVSAPLICYHLSPGSLEAMWKYLLICSVGIALALFGTIAMTVAATYANNVHGLDMEAIKNASENLNPAWFKAAFIFMLAGYGTKMGLAPFHTWLPDAHSEAPGSISALLSGALLNCSFLGIIRVLDVTPADLQDFAHDLLITLGMISLIVAAFFIIRQSDFKRMLAYSSVEHMGLAAILWGLGAETYALIHMCGHSIIKMSLFLLAGNILLAYGTRTVSEVGGIFGKLPRNAVLWLTGILLICGTPPSPLFVTEFLLVKSAGPVLGSVVLLLLFAVFAGMSMVCLNMCMGTHGHGHHHHHHGHALPLPPEPDTLRLKTTEKLALVPTFTILLALLGGIVLTIQLVRYGG
ncbi:MAG: hypothetical protein J6T08_01335 [Lentisphaeria bacterium]|nr:hypothetical protein [Lentisphaeria bacterium]